MFAGKVVLVTGGATGLGKAAALGFAATGAVVTMENHTVIGGLASAVAECLTDARIAVKIAKIGMPDRFIECGSADYPVEKYGMSAAGRGGSAADCEVK